MYKNKTLLKMQSINQISARIRKSKDDLEKCINQVQIEPLGVNEDLQHKFCSIDSILSSIPSNEKLQETLKESSRIKKQHTILNYDGNYEIVKKAQQRIEFMKSQARDAYFLMSDLKLNRECLEFEQLVQQNAITLKSYDLTINQSTKKSRVCKKNSILQSYFVEEKKQEDLENLKNIKNQENKKLTKDDILIAISFYDSINGSKTHQKIFLADHPLTKLQQMDCIIQKLQQSQNQPNQQLYGCFLLIEDRIYLHGPRKSNEYIDKIIQSIQTTSSNSILKFQMSKTLFRQLRVVLGKPYMFRHLGGCDHTIVFKEFRIFDENLDIAKKSRYPFNIYEAKFKTRKCEGCQYNNANIVVVCDQIKKGNNTYLCLNCFESLYPQQSNSKNCFRALKYIHD